jgi:hypothetical protein
VLNLTLGVTGFVHQPDKSLLRKIQQCIEETVDLCLSDPGNASTFDYLREKRLLPDTLIKGSRKKRRYTGFSLSKDGDIWIARDRSGAGLSEIPIHKIDVWMSDPSIPSTIGVPTPDNVEEILELALQLHLLARSKNTWTSAAQLVRAFREASSIKNPENPFLLGLEILPLLRQIIAVDGLILRELLRVIPDSEVVKRDELAGAFPEIVQKAVDECRRLGAHVDFNTIQFLKLVKTTGERRAQQSRGPGVLQHRLSPRLEWLVDFGYLSKEGLAKNGFEYRVLPGAKSLLRDLDTSVGDVHWAEAVVVSQWRTNPSWRHLRSTLEVTKSELSIFKAYKMLQKRVGPSSLIDVAFAAGILAADKPFDQSFTDIIQFAQRTKGIELSGGRYVRSPQNIFISEEILKRT